MGVGVVVVVGILSAALSTAEALLERQRRREDEVDSGPAENAVLRVFRASNMLIQFTVK
jgi:hypothetical protein